MPPPLPEWATLLTECGDPGLQRRVLEEVLEGPLEAREVSAELVLELRRAAGSRAGPHMEQTPFSASMVGHPSELSLPKGPEMETIGFQWEHTFVARLFGMGFLRAVHAVFWSSRARQLIAVIFTSMLTYIALAGITHLPGTQPEFLWAFLPSSFLVSLILSAMDMRLVLLCTRTFGFWLNFALGLLLIPLNVHMFGPNDLRIPAGALVAIGASSLQTLDALPPSLATVRFLIGWGIALLSMMVAMAWELNLIQDVNNDPIVWGSFNLTMFNPPRPVNVTTSPKDTNLHIMTIIAVLALQDAIHFTRFGNSRYATLYVHVHPNPALTDTGPPPPARPAAVPASLASSDRVEPREAATRANV